MIKLFKNFLIIISIIFLNSSLKAQQTVGDLTINAGIGAGTYLKSSNLLEISVPPLSISADYGVFDEYGPGVVSFGGYFGYTGMKEEYYDIGTRDYEGYKYSILSMGARATYHYNVMDGLDIYGGIIIGYYLANKSYYGSSPTLWNTPPLITPDISYAFFIGGNYMLTNVIGAFAEIGYGINHFRIGISFNL